MMWRFLTGAVRELTNRPHPDDHRGPPQIISATRDRQRVRAASGSESTRHLTGTTIQGDRTVVSTHRTDIRRGIYDIHIEEWQTKGVEETFTDPRHSKEDAAYLVAEQLIYYQE